MDDLNKKMADYLHRKRLEEGFKVGRTVSQSEMARRIGIPQGSLSQYENGTRLPNDENKHKLAAYLGVEIYEILGGPLMMPDNRELRRVARLWDKLTPDMQKRFANQVEDEVELWEDKIKEMGK